MSPIVGLCVPDTERCAGASRISVKVCAAVRGREKARSTPYVILREAFDDWAILFDPGTGEAFGLNPVGVHVWKLLDGEHSVDEIVPAIRRDAREVPQEPREHLIAFLQELIEHGLAGYVIEQPHDIGDAHEHAPTASLRTSLTGPRRLANMEAGRCPTRSHGRKRSARTRVLTGVIARLGLIKSQVPARPGLVPAALPVVSSTMVARPASLPPRAAMAPLFWDLQL